MVKIIQGERVCRQGRLAVGCSAAILDPAGQKMLLIRRSDSGRWAVPGGYMEPGESFTEACTREILEETGVYVQVGRLIAVYTSPHALLDYGHENRFQLVVLHFAAEPVRGDLRVSEETIGVGYFSSKEIEQMEMSGFNRQRVDDGFVVQTATFVREDFSLL
jgi:ADP-ribose pyrophosphatase YjhB (NUDIX family)